MHLHIVNLDAKFQSNSFDVHCFEILCLQHTLDKLSLTLPLPTRGGGGGGGRGFSLITLKK